MGKTSLAYITQENQELSAGIEKLKSGELSTAELDALTENAKSLYEALIVLRFKAFEKHLGKPIEAVVEVKPEPKTEDVVKEEQEEAVAFDLSQEDETPEPKAAKETTETMFDFSGSIEEESPIEAPEIKIPEKSEDDFDINAFDEEEDNPEETEDDSLNSQFKDSRDGSLRKQLGRSAVEDLKSEIGIAKKFEYINTMFTGKAEVYDAAINELNTCGSDEAAKNLLNNYAKDYNWDLDDKIIIKFIELVERRYI